jgi:hypothetical protein
MGFEAGPGGRPIEGQAAQDHVDRESETKLHDVEREMGQGSLEQGSDESILRSEVIMIS